MSHTTHVVAAILQNPDGKLLITTRPQGKAFAGLWEFAGGKVEIGETHGSALVRELREELGLDLVGVVFHHCFSFETPHAQKPNHNLAVHFYRAKMSKALCPQPQENQQLAWVSLDEIAHYPFIPSNAALLAALPTLLT